MELRRSSRKRPDTASSPGRGLLPQGFKRRRLLARPPSTPTPTPTPPPPRRPLSYRGEKEPDGATIEVGSSSDDDEDETDYDKSDYETGDETGDEMDDDTDDDSDDEQREDETQVKIEAEADGPTHVPPADLTRTFLERVEPVWGIPNINTFLPPGLQPETWGHDTARRLAIIARRAGPEKRDWVMQELQKYAARANDSRGLTLAAVKFVYNKATDEGVFEPTRAPALPRYMQPSSSATREVHSISDSAQGSPNNTKQSPQDLARNPPDQDWEGSTTRTSRTLLEELAHAESRASRSRFGHRPPISVATRYTGESIH